MAETAGSRGEFGSRIEQEAKAYLVACGGEARLSVLAKHLRTRVAEGIASLDTPAGRYSWLMKVSHAVDRSATLVKVTLPDGKKAVRLASAAPKSGAENRVYGAVCAVIERSTPEGTAVFPFLRSVRAECGDARPLAEFFIEAYPVLAKHGLVTLKHDDAGETFVFPNV